MKEYKTCVIKIHPDNPDLKMDVKSNGVNVFDIVNALDKLQKHYATKIVEEARKHVGDDVKKQEQWIDMMIKQRRVGDN